MDKQMRNTQMEEANKSMAVTGYTSSHPMRRTAGDGAGFGQGRPY